TVVKWLKQPGDSIEEDEPVLEIATDKVDSDVPSPVAGILKEQRFAENSVAQVGDVIAIIETEAAANEKAADEWDTQSSVAESVDTSVATDIPGMEQLEETENESVPKSESSEGRFYSPLVRNIANEEGISPAELDSIPGTGIEGRVTKQDILNYLFGNSPFDTRTSIGRAH